MTSCGRETEATRSCTSCENVAEANLCISITHLLGFFLGVLSEHICHLLWSLGPGQLHTKLPCAASLIHIVNMPLEVAKSRFFFFFSRKKSLGAKSDLSCRSFAERGLPGSGLRKNQLLAMLLAKSVRPDSSIPKRGLRTSNFSHTFATSLLRR